MAIMVLLAGGCCATDRKLSNSGDSLGGDQRIQHLFNGRDLDGWIAYSRDGLSSDGGSWSVKDGILCCEGQPIGYLRTTQKYTNYVLTLKWRFDPDRGAGNSGVLLRVIGEDTVWPNSIEAQLHSRNAGDIWNIGNFPMTADSSRTNGRRTRKEHATNEKPLGEWNTYRIVLDGENLELSVNGLVQNVATDCRVVPGYIALQSEGAPIQFKDIILSPVRGDGRDSSETSTRKE